MKRFSQIMQMVAVLILLTPIAPAVAQTESGEAVYAELLDRYLVLGDDGVMDVDYKGWHENSADTEKLAAYIEELGGRSPSEMERDTAFAYWVNLYNALTLKVILDNYPVDSIRDISSTGTSLLDFKAYTGPWRTKLITVEGRELSLDDIEHEILRPQFKDPRVHYAVNCASIGCPNLKRTPWQAEGLDQDLDEAARVYVNHPRGVTVEADGSVIVSSIYDWFQEDFGGTEAGVLDHLRKYADAELAAKLEGKTDYADHRYDWALNEIKRDQSAG